MSISAVHILGGNLTDSEGRGPGRPRLYEQKTPSRRGAPSVTVRFDPAIYQHVMSQPGGARVYLERLVNEDMRRNTGGVPGEHLGDGKPQSENS